MVCATAFAVTMTVRCAAGTYSLACDSNASIYGIGTNVRIPKDSKTYTIELWMKPSAVYASGEYRCMGQFGFEEGKSTPLVGRTLVSYKDGKVGVFNGGGNGWTTGTTTLEADVWYHVACVFDETAVNKTVVYVNGVQEGANTKTAVGICDRYVVLGAATAGVAISGAASYEAFKGRIADVRVWTVARSAQEIAANYTKRLAGDEEGLLAYWPLDAFGDDEQSFLEVVAGGRSFLQTHYAIVEDDDLALTPTVSRAEGLRRRSASWEADRCGLNTGIDTSLGSAFTLEAWVRPSSTNNGERWILDQFNTGNGRFMFATQDGRPSFYVGGSTSGHVIAPGALATNKWTHLALTRAANDFTIYTNGHVALSQTVNNAHLPPNEPFCIGSSPRAAKNIGKAFLGMLREVRVWSTCRTAEQIREAMGRTLAGTEAGLRGYWPLDEGNGTRIADRVTGGLCTMVDDWPQWELTGVPPVAHTVGANLEAAASFLGDCYTLADTGMSIKVPSYTLEAWVRVQGNENGDAYIASQYKTGTVVSNMIFAVRNNRLAHLQDGHVSTWIEGATELPHNRWFHVAYVQDGSCRRLYVDGVLDAEVDDGIVARPHENEPLRIGYVSHEYSSYRRWSLEGLLAEVRVWNCARTAEEIALYRTHRLRGSERGLVGYWPLNDGANGTLVNRAKGGANGTILTVWNTLDDLSFGDPLVRGTMLIFW